MSSGFVICRRSRVLARRSAWCGRTSCMLRGPWQPPGSAGGVAAAAIMAVPVLRGRAREPPPGWAMRPGPALPRTGCRFRRSPCSRSGPVRGMMATGASERTHHDVAQEGSCANDQDPEWRCLGHRRCGGGRMSPARGELPYVDEHAITIATPRERVWNALQRYTATSLRIPEGSPSPDSRHPATRRLRSPGQRAGP